MMLPMFKKFPHKERLDIRLPLDDFYQITNIAEPNIVAREKKNSISVVFS